jgi:hypothetical protein
MRISRTWEPRAREENEETEWSAENCSRKREREGEREGEDGRHCAGVTVRFALLPPPLPPSE